MTLVGDHIEDAEEFRELERARDVQLACYEFEQYLRNLWKHGSGLQDINQIWDMWHECTFNVRDVLG